MFAKKYKILSFLLLLPCVVNANINNGIKIYSDSDYFPLMPLNIISSIDENDLIKLNASIDFLMDSYGIRKISLRNIDDYYEVLIHGDSENRIIRLDSLFIETYNHSLMKKEKIDVSGITTYYGELRDSNKTLNVMKFLMIYNML